MKKLLYVGHGHHNKTKSTVFLIELFKTAYEVSRFDLDPQVSDCYADLEKLEVRDFDVVVVFQVMPPVAELRKRISWRHGVFFPMFDYYQGCMTFDCSVWKDYADFTIVNFSKTLNDKLKACGFDARYVQYFPKPEEVDDWGNIKSVFFWQRITKLNLPLLARVLENIKLKHVHVHKVLDPGESFTPIPADHSKVERFFKRVKLTESTWYETREGMRADMLASAFYMAPRPYEGIGMSFLEAMAAGRCVIAPNCPTMNEYIQHGVNGLLYDWNDSASVQRPAVVAIPSCGVRTLQRNARDAVRCGYDRWVLDQRKILDWLADDVRCDREKLIATAQRQGWVATPLNDQERLDVNFLRRIVREKRVGWWNPFAPVPDVTVVTVVFNAVKAGRVDSFRQCLDSVQAQTGVRVEHLVVDGGSRDGTLRILAEYQNAHHPLRILSRSDKGIYDAMNRGLALANGRYVTFLNSDDYYHDPLGLRDSVDSLDETNAEFSYAPIRVLGEDGEPIDHPNCHPDTAKIFKQMEFSHQSVVIRTASFRDIGGFDLSYRSAADYDSVLRMVFAGFRACHVSRSYVSFRMGGFSCVNMARSQRECGRIFSRLYEKHLQVRLSEDEGLKMHLSQHQEVELEERLVKYWARTFADESPDFEKGAPGEIYKLIFEPKDKISFRDNRQVFGLYLPESWGAWAENRLRIVNVLPEALAGHAVGVSLNVGAFHEMAQTSVLVVSCNGRTVGRLSVPNVMPETHSLVLPPVLTAERTLVIDIENMTPAPLRQGGLGIDTRNLGISFGCIEFTLCDEAAKDMESTKFDPDDRRVSGLYPPEAWGAWGRKSVSASFWVPRALVGKPLQLKMKVGICHCEGEVPELSVAVNGTCIGTVTLQNVMPEPLVFEIPPDMTTSGVLILTLTSSVSHCPMTEGFGEDPRDLGVSFGGLEVVRPPATHVVAYADGGITGLYAPEDGWAWGTERVTVPVSLPDELRGAGLAAKIQAGSFDRQPIAVSIAEDELTRYVPSKPIPEDVHGFVIPSRYTATGKFDLALTVEHAVVPKERGIGNDQRRLGVSFVKISFQVNADAAVRKGMNRD